jgi:hypothetical protein
MKIKEILTSIQCDDAERIPKKWLRRTYLKKSKYCTLTLIQTLILTLILTVTLSSNHYYSNIYKIVIYIKFDKTLKKYFFLPSHKRREKRPRTIFSALSQYQKNRRLH